MYEQWEKDYEARYSGDLATRIWYWVKAVILFPFRVFFWFVQFMQTFWLPIVILYVIVANLTRIFE